MSRVSSASPHIPVSHRIESNRFVACRVSWRRRSAGNWTVVHAFLSLARADLNRHLNDVSGALTQEVRNTLSSAAPDETKLSAYAAAVGLPLEQAAARGSLEAVQLGTEFRFLPQLPGARTRRASSPSDSGIPHFSTICTCATRLQVRRPAAARRTSWRATARAACRSLRAATAYNSAATAATNHFAVLSHALPASVCVQLKLLSDASGCSCECRSSGIQC